MTELILSVAAVIFISALCSLFEAVMLSAPLSHVESLAHSGDRAGRAFRGLRQNVDRPLSAILSLNTIANTGGAAVAGAAFLKVFGDLGKEYEVYFTIFITLSVLFLSEVMPKTVGAVYSRQLVRWVARPLQVLVWVFRPLIFTCGLATRAFSKGQGHSDVSAEDLSSLARLGARIGSIDADEARVIENIIQLKSKSARDVMTPRIVVFALPESFKVADARTESNVWAHSRIPVYSTDFEDIVGIVFRRDILAALAQGRDHVTLSVLMRPVHFVAEATSLDRILNDFLEKRQHMFMVIDEYGGLAGVLTLEDVLEEILGKEIVDELDQVEDMRELARKRRAELQRRNAPPRPEP